MAVIPKYWYEPGRIPSILEGFIPGWKESFQDGRNPSKVGLHILKTLFKLNFKLSFNHIYRLVNIVLGTGLTWVAGVGWLYQYPPNSQCGLCLGNVP